MQVYRINISRIFAYFYFQVVLIFGVIAFLFVERIALVDIDLLFLLLSIVIFTIISVPNIYFFINHFSYFRGGSITYNQAEETLSIVTRKYKHHIRKSEILGINQYGTSSSKLSWYGIYLWELLLDGSSFKIATILISKQDFLEIFGGKLIIEKPNGSLSV